jgi:hypothetical protein
MDQIVLNDEILDKIKNDAFLFGGVAARLKVSPSTLPDILRRNDPKLTQASVLKLLRDHLGLQDNELLTILQETE